MAIARFHPLLLVSATSFMVAMFLPYLLFGLRPSTLAQIALLALGSPFAVLIVGHLYGSRTRRRNLLVALYNFPLWVGWLFTTVLMWYFKPGLPGAFVLGALLSGAAGVLLLCLRLVREPVHA